MSEPYETIISKLGSRLCFNFRPQTEEFYFSPVGRFMDRRRNFIFQVTIGDRSWGLPFGPKCERFKFIRQSVTMTDLSFLCAASDLPVEILLRICSPFYPQDEKICTCPLFYLTVEIKNQDKKAVTGAVNLGVLLEAGERAVFLNDRAIRGIKAESTFCFSDRERVFFQNSGSLDNFSFRDIPACFGMAASADDEDVTFAEDGTARWSFAVPCGTLAEKTLAFAGFVEQPVLKIKGRDFAFKYHDFFQDVEAVLEYGMAQKDAILVKTGLFDSTVADSTLSNGWKELTALAFQNFLCNTWWVKNETGDEWFTVWEGNCFYHSTVDVEFHQAIFYLLYWPSLLRMELEQWVNFIDGKGVLSHDMGSKLEIDHACYTHPMPVEENANYLILLGAYWLFTGDLDTVKRCYTAAKKLVHYLFTTDTTGSGLPSVGCANTFDDGSPALQYGKEQVYLGLKMWGAYQYMQRMAEVLKDEPTVQRCVEEKAKIQRTVKERAWLGDHFAICLSQDANLPKPAFWSSEAVAKNGRLMGWDGYSNCSFNGLFFPTLNGVPLPIDDDQIRADMKSTYRATLTEFGCSNTSLNKVGWVSQNLLREVFAAYMNDDYTFDVDRYLNYQIYMNTRFAGSFYEGFHKNHDGHVTYYPRSVIAVGYLAGICRLTVDRVKGTCSVRPLRSPLRVPLLPFADWSAGKIPWCDLERRGSRTVGKITGSDLPPDIKLVIE